MRRLLGTAFFVVALMSAGTVIAAEQEGRESDGLTRQRVGCGGFHLIRANSNINLSEMFTTNISVRNQNPGDPVTVERLTIYDAFGTIVYDAGSAVGVPLALNTDFAPALDLTAVPPHGNFYVGTRHIFGFVSIPTGNINGASLSFIVQYATSGKADLVAVSSSNLVRQRFLTATGVLEGDEHTRVRQDCVRLK
jgi:hypothetical protein